MNYNNEVPLVSVIIPVYNRPLQVVNAINSVLQQEAVNVEVIIVDDGSTDNTPKLVKSIKDPRIRFISLPQKGNANIARNKGVEMASGGYIAFLDSDDRYLPNHLKTELETLQTQSADVVIGSSYVYNKGIKTKRITRPIKKNERAIDFLLSPDGFASTCGLLITNEFSKKIKWNESLRRHQDYDYFEQMVDASAKIAANTVPTFEIYWDKERVHVFEDCIKFMEPRAANININYYINYLLDMHRTAGESPKDIKYKKYYKKELEKRAEYISYRAFANLQENNKGVFNFYNRLRFGLLILRTEASYKIHEKLFEKQDRQRESNLSKAHMPIPKELFDK